MKTVTHEIQTIVNEFTQRITAIPEEQFSAKPLPHKWSKKEVLGHLIDSAQNNLRRFITSQYEKTPPKIVYDQDFWVAANQYQNASGEEVMQLWKLINLRICSVLDAVPQNKLGVKSDTGKEETQLHSIQWLAEDYIKHMKHHLNQIISGSFDVIYP